MTRNGVDRVSVNEVIRTSLSVSISHGLVRYVAEVTCHAIAEVGSIELVSVVVLFHATLRNDGARMRPRSM